MKNAHGFVVKHPVFEGRPVLIGDTVVYTSKNPKVWGPSTATVTALEFVRDSAVITVEGENGDKDSIALGRVVKHVSV